MRCKKHLTDFSSINGVCATCLRQRLFPLLKAQTQTEAQNQENKLHFPQSVSPYISQRNDVWKESSVTVEVKNSNDTLKKATISSMIMGLFRSKKHDHQKKESRTFSVDEKGRGMSPDGENCSSESLKQTPRRTLAGVRRNGHSRNVSGLKFCLSPMVRASPNVRCGGGGQVDMTYYKNRSRKFADFGRSNNY